MKYILIFLIAAFSNSALSQCEYSLVEYDNSSGKGIIKTYPITLDLFETPMNGRVVLAFLVRTGNQYFIELEITEDSSSQDLEPICLDSGSRLSFLLKNNKSVSLLQVDEKICGVKSYDRRSGYTTISNYGMFILTQEAFDNLMKSEVMVMKISSSNYNKSFVLKDELEIPKDEDFILTQPSRFFIDNIDCMINPKFK